MKTIREGKLLIISGYFMGRNSAEDFELYTEHSERFSSYLITDHDLRDICK